MLRTLGEIPFPANAPEAGFRYTRIKASFVLDLLAYLCELKKDERRANLAGSTLPWQGNPKEHQPGAYHKNQNSTW